MYVVCLYTVNNYRQKLCFFSIRICYKLCSKSLLKELHRIKLLHIEIIDNAGRKKTKLLPIEFIGTSHNSVDLQDIYEPKSLDYFFDVSNRHKCRNPMTTLKFLFAHAYTKLAFLDPWYRTSLSHFYSETQLLQPRLT